jgi:nucleoside 2-deoxyribosyltransferase
MIIYLAGGMSTGWQDRVSPLLAGHELLDPRSWADPDPTIYTELDLAAIRRADALLVQMGSDNPSGFGLSVELGYAKALGKRIVFLDEISGDWRSRYFGMHRVMSDVVCTTLEKAAAALND